MNNSGLPKKLVEWLFCVNSYGDRMVEDWEFPYIVARWHQIKDEITIIEGSIEENQPNAILVDISHIKNQKEGRKDKAYLTLAHYLRPCPCDECPHDWQYECFLVNCKCCTEVCN